MNFNKKLLLFFFLFAFFIPFSVFAYSDKVILGGNNIGISVDTKNVLVVGFYKVDNKFIAKDKGIKLGDNITHVGGVRVYSIDDVVSLINEKKVNDKVEITILRNNKSHNINIDLYEENGVYKTGIYIKNNITGIGTLTYIDPESKIFGALGHEIISSPTNKISDISKGEIFKADVIGTVKSRINFTGEKRAVFDSDVIYGSIDENTIKGIYGVYSSEIDYERLIEVGDSSSINLGKAYIYTVLDDNSIGEYEINILKIDDDSETKNILFEITDNILIKKTNGVIKGMSGSPIVQNGKLIGAVTHAIVSDNSKGYGIFITSMLEEGEN